MKIVVEERNTKSVPYQVIRATGYVAAVFSLVVCILLIANNLNVKRVDPVHLPAMTNLVAELKSSPGDQSLREQIRELDYLSRKAFFTSQHFNQMAILLLVGGLAVMVISFKTLNAYQAAPPYPDSRDPKDDPTANALWARKSVTAAGLVLLGFALVLALPRRSPLDTASSPVPKSTAPAKPAVEATTTKVASPAAAFPTLAEMAEQWPGFLGAASGHSRGETIPVDWDVATGKGIKWRQEVPLPGMNSPVVWKNLVILSGANATNREIFGFDAGSGELKWKCAVPSSPNSAAKAPKVTEDTGYAASTTATDGSRAFAIFANGDLAGCDFAGKLLWQRSLGLPENSYGYASSLVAFEDLVIVQFDRKKDSFIAGIDAATGKTRWETKRDFGPSWASPQVINPPAGAQLITAANPNVIAYDPRTGKELWRVECLKGAEVAVSPAYADGLVYAAAEYLSLTAIDVSTHQILWQNKDVIPGISTPLVVNGLMFFGLSDGGIVCLDAKTGAEKWRADTDEGVFSSPVLVGENVYLVDRGGTVHIFKADGGSYQAMGAPKLGEEAYGTPAIVGDGLYIRGVKHLFRIGS